MVGKTEGVVVEERVADASETLAPGKRALLVARTGQGRWRRLDCCGMRRDPGWCYQLTGCQQSGWTEVQLERRK